MDYVRLEGQDLWGFLLNNPNVSYTWVNPLHPHDRLHCEYKKTPDGARGDMEFRDFLDKPVPVRECLPPNDYVCYLFEQDQVPADYKKTALLLSYYSQIGISLSVVLVLCILAFFLGLGAVYFGGQVYYYLRGWR